jgi:hypothetical protein
MDILTARSILKVSPNASPDDIKDAYKRACLETHPDKTGKKDYTDFLNVTKAYKLLSNYSGNVEQNNFSDTDQIQLVKKRVDIATLMISGYTCGFPLKCEPDVRTFWTIFSRSYKNREINVELQESIAYSTADFLELITGYLPFESDPNAKIIDAYCKIAKMIALVGYPVIPTSNFGIGTLFRKGQDRNVYCDNMVFARVCTMKLLIRDTLPELETTYRKIVTPDTYNLKNISIYLEILVEYLTEHILIVKKYYTPLIEPSQ